MKQTKKSKRNTSFFSSDNEMAKLILLIVIVALAFGVFYVITLFVIKKDDTKQAEEAKETTIQYDKILIGNILSQKEEEYYVLVYKEDDQYVDLYKSYLSYYQSNENSVPYYYAELDNVFNKEFVAEKSNLNAEIINQMKFSQTTLLRIIDGKVISTYEGKDNITGKLGRMTK